MSVNEVTESDKGEQTLYFLGLVCDANEKTEIWTMQLQLDSIPVEFIIVTGAHVDVINGDVFLIPDLEPSDLPLDSPEQELFCLVCFMVTESYEGGKKTFI